MVTIEDAIVARIDKKGKHFEILVDPEIAYDLKSGKNVSTAKMLAVSEVYSDSNKGEKASDSDLEEIFGTRDVNQISEKIVKKGDLQVTTAFRNKKTDEKKRKIAAIISKNAMNPQTKLPHPLERILKSMEKSNINIDPFKPANEQVDEVLDALKPIIPISMDTLIFEILVPAKHTGSAYGLLKRYNIKKDEWRKDGSLYVKVDIPASLKDELYGKLNSMTDGDFTLKEVKKWLKESLHYLDKK